MSQFATTHLKGEHRQASMSLSMADTSKDSPDLVFAGMKGQEKLGRPFRYVIRVLTQDSGNPNNPTVLTEEQWNSMLGGTVTVTLDLSASSMNSARRYFHGYIEKITHVGHMGNTGVSVYTLQLVPKVSFLKHSRTNRIFLEKSIPDIIEMVLNHAGFGKGDEYQYDITTSEYAEHEMVVQYDESDFDFLHRLMELIGIAYHFEHDSEKHTMVFTDAKSSAANVSQITGDKNASEVKIQYRHSSLWKSGEVGIWAYRTSAQLGTLSVAGSYYDFENASLLNKSSRLTTQPSNPDFINNRDWMRTAIYPLGRMAAGEEGHSTSWTGSMEAKAIANRHRVKNETRLVEGNYRLFSTGYQYELEGHPHKHENGKYQIIAMKFIIGTEDYPLPHSHKNTPGKTGAHDGIFQVKMKVLPTSTVFAPESVTPKSTIHGVQTATVVKSGEAEKTVDTDEYGRVYVQFHWNDSSSALDENNEDQRTALVRVSQFWAGRSRGAIFTPRVGDEVVVAFLDGDPDYPIVVGSVYNSVNEPFIEPSELPLVSGIRTRVTSTDEDKLESSYKSINHSDLMFDDLYSSETTGLTLRSFRNSAGSEYSFEADDEDNKNLKDDCAAFTIAAPEGEEKDIVLTMNVGSDVNTMYKGNQSGAAAFMRKKIVTSVGPLSSSTMNTYSISEFSMKIANLAIYSLKYENPVCELKIGPVNNSMEALVGKNELKSGFPTSALGMAGLAMNFAHWAATFASKDKAGVDEGSLGIAEKVIEAGGIAIGIASILKEGFSDVHPLSVGEVVTRPGVVSISSEDREENETKIYMLPETMMLKASSEEGIISCTSYYTAEQYNMSMVAAAGASNFALTAEQAYLSAGGEASLIMVGGVVSISAAASTTKAVFGEEQVTISTSSGTSKVYLDPMNVYMQCAQSYSVIEPGVGGIVVGQASMTVSPEEIDLDCGSCLGVSPESISMMGTTVLVNSAPPTMLATASATAAGVEATTSSEASLVAAEAIGVETEAQITATTAVATAAVEANEATDVIADTVSAAASQVAE